MTCTTGNNHTINNYNKNNNCYFNNYYKNPPQMTMLYKKNKLKIKFKNSMFPCQRTNMQL